MSPTVSVAPGGVRARRTALVLLAAFGLAAAAAVLTVIAGQGGRRVADAGPASLEDAVLVVAAATGALVATWLVVGTLVSVADVLGRRPARRAGVPKALHRLVTLGMGVALLGAGLPAVTSATGPVAPTTASAAATDVSAHDREPERVSAEPGPPDPGPPDPGPPDPAWTPPVPVPVPRTAAPADPLVVPTPRASMSVAETVTVHRGDTLWDIAARHLPAGATDAEIAAEWPRWHAANVSLIGSDPDLLLPGQLLRAPGDRP